MRQKVIIMCLCLFIVSMNGLAKAESVNIEGSNYNLASNKFVEYYNKSQYENIFNMFSSEMKAALPLETNNKFFMGLKRAYGNIISKEYIRRNPAEVIYKLTFEKAVFSLKLALNDNDQLNGLYIEQFIPQDLPVIERTTTKLMLPFKGEWYVVWGGDVKEQNYHVSSQAQKNAFDFVIMDSEGKSYRSKRSNNEDYYAFNQAILSPCNAEVIMVVDGMKDNIPGNLNPYFALGNTVVLKTTNKEFIR